MKIAVEAAGLLRQDKTGVEYYTYRLLDAVLRIDRESTYELAFMAFATKPKPILGLDYPNVIERRVKWLPGKIYNLFLRTPFGLPIDLIAGTRPDIFLFPNFVRWPLVFTKKSVVVIYDTSYLDFPAVTKTKHFQMYLKHKVPQSIRKASHVVVISESTKRSLIQHYNTPPDKISVVVPALDLEVYQPSGLEAISAVKAKYGIDRNYILYLGTLEPRKNIVGLVKAYQALPSELRDRYQLVLAGGKGWGSEAIEAAAKTVDRRNLVRTGYVDQADVTALYSGAKLFVFPSIFEGWGMPIAEAQACGTPVLTADNSSLPEVGGDAAEYAKTDDQADLNAKLEALLQDPEQLDQMRRAGLINASQFTWAKSAQALLEVFQEVSKRA